VNEELASGQKNSLKECVYVNSALKIQFHIVIMAKKQHSYRLLSRRFGPLG